MELVSKKSFTALIAVLMPLLLTLSACTPKSTEPANTLHVATVAKIKGLDPAFADDLYSGTEVARAYEGLLQYNYLKRPYVLEGQLAEGLPSLSADKLTYTFKLKKGVLFQDDPCFKATQGKGREVTADDFIYSFKRLADPKLASSGWWILDGLVAGLNGWHDAQAKSAAVDYTQPLEGLQALDPYTLRIKLIKPSYQFLYNLAQQFASVVPREAVELYGKEFQNHAVGTGPFQLKAFNGNSKIIWVRSPTFRRELYPSEGASGDKEKGLLEDAGKPIPFIDQVVVTVFEESQPMWLNFMAGKLDISPIPKDNYSTAIGKDHQLQPDLQAKNMKLFTAPNLDIGHFSFNMADPLIGKNKFLRQALSLAFDSQGFIDTFFNGNGIVAHGPIPPGLPGYDPSFKNPYRQVNLQKAKELLAQAGYPNGQGLAPIEFNTLSDTNSRQQAEYNEKQFAAIGVHLKVNAYSWPEFQQAVKNKRGQLWLFGWIADYPDAQDFLQLFYSKNVSPGANDANYSNPQFDRLYDQSLKLPDGAERTAIYQKMVRILTEDCPWIFVLHHVSFGVTQPWAKNYKLHDFDLSRDKYVRIDTALKK